MPENIQEIHIESDDSKEYFDAVERNYGPNSRGCLPLTVEYRSDYDDDDIERRRINKIQVRAKNEEDFKSWCFKEKEVLSDMSDKEIIKVVTRINRRTKWNAFMDRHKLPFKYNLRQYHERFSSYLSEYFLRMSNQSDFKAIHYDPHRGMYPSDCRLDLEVYKVEYAKIMGKKRSKKRSWFSKLFSFK
jgi:hypothetical protein